MLGNNSCDIALSINSVGGGGGELIKKNFF